MKWIEVRALTPGTPLTRFGGRRAIFLEAHEESRTMTVRYLDTREKKRELPSEFDQGWKAPQGTVARGSL